MLKKLPNGSYIDPNIIRMIEVVGREKCCITNTYFPDRIIIHLADGDRRCIPCESYMEAEQYKEEIAQLCV